MFNRRVFSIGARDYHGDDLILAAMWWNQWSAFERSVVEGLACDLAAVERGDSADQEQVSAAASEFRYDRDLIAAVEMEAWLDQAGLTVDAWMDALTRAVRRAAHHGQLDTMVCAYPPGIGQIDEALVPDGFCSSAFSALAATLAGRAAIADAAVAGLGPDEARHATVDAVCERNAGRIDRWPIAGARERIAHIAENDALYAMAVEQAVTPAALRAHVSNNQLDWMRLEIETLTVSNEHIAREALLCCREEALSLAQVGAEIRVPAVRRTLLLEEAGEALRPVLLSAPPGDILEPIAVNEGFQLLTVLQKTPPALSHDEVHARARAVSIKTMTDREMANRVRWAVRF